MANDDKKSSISPFTRSKEHRSGAPGWELARVIGAVGHLLIPPLMYKVMYDGWWRSFFAMTSWSGELVDLSPERKTLYMVLCTFYCVRWSFGMMTMLGTVDMATGAVLPVVGGLVVHTLTYVLGSMGAFWSPVSSYHLTPRDYVAGSWMVLAGILQHGAEAQRWWFKRNPAHKGQLHTSGLFGYARFINHTGHVLNDWAICLFVPNIGLMIFFAWVIYQLWYLVTPETVAHMKSKYGSKYDDYVKKTPSLFIPGIY